MAKGRKPKPKEELKDFREDRQGNRLRDLESEGFVVTIPEPRGELSPRALEIWNSILASVTRTKGWMMQVDLPLLEEYCHVMGELQRLRNMNKSYKDKNTGLVKKHANHSMYLELLTQARQISQLMGFNPNTRASLRLTSLKKDDNTKSLEYTDI